VHLRPPSIAPGVQAFLWALAFTVYMWLFMLAVGVDGAVAAIVAVVLGAGCFLLVRLYGEDITRRRSRTRRAAP
jgi:amino acid permease